VILPGPFMTEEELTQAVASLEARAEVAERNGLPRTARSWRDAIENMRGRTGGEEQGHPLTTTNLTNKISACQQRSAIESRRLIVPIAGQEPAFQRLADSPFHLCARWYHRHHHLILLAF
jgi:hypothetical protein